MRVGLAILPPIELGEGLDAELVVGEAGGLADGVHAPDAVAHIYATEGEGGGEDVAQGAATSHIAVVDETLEGNTGTTADLGKDGSAIGIGGVLLSRIDLDDRTATETRMVGRIHLLTIVGMPGVSVVGADHETLLDHAIEVIAWVGGETEGAMLGNDETLEHLRQEGRGCALLGATASLFVVEDGQHLGAG